MPVRFGDEHVGSFELYVPWAPIAADIHANTNRLYLVLAGGPAPAVGRAVPDHHPDARLGCAGIGRSSHAARTRTAGSRCMTI